MPTGAQQQMTEAAMRLLAQGGVQAASFSAVLESSGAPRGSIYHHFPRGKDELIVSAIDLALMNETTFIESLSGRSTAEVIDAFIAEWRSVLEESDFSSGCAVLGVPISSDSPDLIAHAGESFRSWRRTIASVLEASGLPTAKADALSTTMLAATEGAVVLCRAERSYEPLETVATQLQALAKL
jgi:AcrR family transcriptional regulator